MLNFKKQIGYDFNYLDNKEKEYWKKVSNILKKVVTSELEKSAKDKYEKTNFYVKTNAYQRYDDLSGDYWISIELKHNYLDEFEYLYNNKINLLEDIINKEVELIKRKLENIKDYVKELNKQRAERYKFYSDYELEHPNITFEWKEDDKGDLNEEKVKEDLLFIKKWLENRCFTEEEIESIDNDYIDYISIDFHPIYHDTFDVRLYLTNKEEFNKDFINDYPFINNEKKEYNDKIDMKKYIKKALAEDNKSLLYIASPIIETKKAIEEMLKSLKETIEKLPEDKKYLYDSDLKEYEKSLKIINSKKEIFWKYDEYENSYFLKTNNIKDLAELIRMIIKNNYNLNDNLVSNENINIYIEYNFLNY